MYSYIHTYGSSQPFSLPLPHLSLPVTHPTQDGTISKAEAKEIVHQAGVDMKRLKYEAWILEQNLDSVRKGRKGIGGQGGNHMERVEMNEWANDLPAAWIYYA